MALGKLADCVSFLTVLPHDVGLPRRKNFNGDPNTMLSGPDGVRGNGLRVFLTFSEAEMSQAVLQFIKDGGYQDTDVAAFVNWFKHLNVNWDWALNEEAEHDVGNKPPGTLSIQYSKPMCRVRQTEYAGGQLKVWGEGFLNNAIVRLINDGTHAETAKWDPVNADGGSTFRYASITKQVQLNPGTYFVEITNRLGPDYTGGPEVTAPPLVSDTFIVP